MTVEPMLAYLDPASGSLILQAIVGSMIGFGLFFRQSLARMFRAIRRS